MKNKRIIITAVLLIIAVVTNFMIVSDGSARAVDSLSSFAMGVLTGILLLQIAKVIKDRP
jgi:Flp pilus assembly protein CpaB